MKKLSVFTMALAIFFLNFGICAAARFVDNGDGTVTDTKYGLMWQKSDDGTTRTWTDAGTYADGLELAGNTDWRIPTIDELRSIIDYSRFNPAIDSTFSVQADLYWSGTEGAHLSTAAWAIHLLHGDINNYLKTDSYYLICVRNSQTSATDTLKPSFFDNGNGTITDQTTGLMWQKTDDGTTRSWTSATTYANDLSLAGYTDWRLPSIDELGRLVDYSKYNPAVNAAFNSQASAYWTNTLYANDSSNAWRGGFYYGVLTFNDKAVELYVRCVRQGSTNQSPTAAFTATPESGTAPLAVSLDASGSSDPDGTISTYAWSTSDSQSTSERTASLTFSSPGTYTITLTVTDDDGATATAEKTITASASQDPIAYYPFNGNANDESGNGNHGTVNGATLTTDRYGNADKAYSFDGQNDYIHVAKNITNNNEFTWVIWFKPEINLPSERVALLNQGGDPGQFGISPSFEIMESGTIDFNTSAPGSGVVGLLSSMTSQWSAGVWYQVVITSNDNSSSGNRKMYINGAFESQLGVYKPFGEILNNFYIGANPAYNAQYFYGDLDDIRVYERELSASEIQTLYNSEKPADNQSPTASFTTTPTSGSAPLAVSLDASASTDSDGTIATYAWSTDDSQTTTGRTASLTFNSTGTYEITLTVTDDKGATATANKTITVSEAAAVTYELTTNPGSGGSITSSSNKTSFTDGETVTLTATPSSSCYEFTSWGGACSGSSSTCTLTMDAAKTVSASFTAKKYTITKSASNGTITTNPSGSSFDCNSTVSLSASPNTGYSFVKWSGDASGTSSNTTIRMTGNKSVTATFEKLQANTFSLSTNAGNGGIITVSPSKTSFTDGETVTLTATPSSSCYEFTSWGGACSGSSSTCTLTMDAAKTVSASFTAKKYTITKSASNGTITTNPSGSSFDCNSTVSLSASPNTGYSFVKWSGDASGTTSNTTIRMTGNKSVTATFEKLQANTFSLSTNAGNGGIITVSPSKSSYTSGETISLTAKANTGYHFVKWSGDASGTSTNTTIKMDASKSVSAVFEKDEAAFFTLKLSASPTTAGKIDASPSQSTYEKGDTIVLTALPNTGHRFDYWEGDISGSQDKKAITITGNMSVIAVFSSSTELGISPSLIEILPEATVKFTVSGGEEPYTWKTTSGKLSTDSGSLNNYTAPSSPGEYKIAVTDGSNNTAEATVKVSSGLAISPSTATVSINVQTDFTVTGGKAPYTITVTMGKASTVTNGKLIYTAPDETGSALLTIEDALGQKQKAEIIIEPVTSALNIAPKQITVGPGGKIYFAVTGGDPDYKWTADNGQLLEITGEEILYIAPQESGDYQIVATDITGNSATSDIKVMAVLKLTPSVKYANPGDDIMFKVQGGEGEYEFTVESGELPLQSSTRIIYTVPELIGQYKIKVTDSLGNTATCLVVVGDAAKVSPTYAYVEPNSATEFKVTGGFPPYTVTADAGDVVDSGNGVYQYIAAETAGIYYITIADANGINTQMEIEVGYPDITISPKELYLKPGESADIAISGGKAPYTLSAEVGGLIPNGQGIYRYQAPEETDLEGVYVIKISDANNNKAAVLVDISYEPKLCLPIDDALAITFACTDIFGVPYRFSMNFEVMLDQPEELFWKLDILSFGVADQTDIAEGCITLNEDISMMIPCANYAEFQFKFKLDFYPLPEDISNIYFKLNMDTFEIK